MDAKTADLALPRMAETAIKGGCTQPYTWEQVLSIVRGFHDQNWSLRKIARDGFQDRVTHATIQRILDGIEPTTPEVRSALGLPVYRTVIVIGGGTIPEGAQVISAEKCECGLFFISNHPARKKCFICSPFRRSKRKGEGIQQ